MSALIDFLRRQPRSYLLVGGAVIVIALGGLGFFIVHRADAASPAARTGRSGLQQVTVATVGSLSPNNAPLSVIGSVVSDDEATILSDDAGEITNVNVQLGSRVSAGEIIASAENSSEQAAVVQAQGEYDAAQAALAQASGATAENSTINSSAASQSATNEQSAADAALQGAYAALDDAVHTKADTIFSNPLSTNPTFLPLTIPDAQLVQTIENDRLSLEGLLNNDSSIASDSAAGDTDANIATMIGDAQTVEAFLADIIRAVDDAVPNQQYSATTITAFQTTMTAARSEVVSAVSSLTTVKSAYDAAQASATTAQNSASGGTTNSIAAAQASVEEATGALDSAKAALAKTIIRSPISGTIINLPVTSGDYVSAFSEVAQVSNPGALKVVVEVTPDDAQTLAVGNSTFVNGTVTGVITEIAPAIDPQTGAIEVDVGLSGDITGLIDGDSVTVDLDRTISQVTATHSSSPIVPIVALKITPEGPVVFTVNPTTHALVAHAVSIGAILGANIEVTQGLTSNMVIVTDARGLTVGELVSVAQSHS